MLKFTYLGLVSLFQFIQFSIACNGFGLRLGSIVNTNGDTPSNPLFTGCPSRPSDIELGFIQVQLTEDCQVLIDGCFTINKSVNDSTINSRMTYRFLGLPILPITVKTRIDDSYCGVLDTFNFPFLGCPAIAEGTYCNIFSNPNTLDVSPYRSYLSAAYYLGGRNVHVDAKVNYGDDTTDCFELNLEVFRS